MKKGFTIIEIIISIGLLLIVGTSTTFFILSNKNNNELEKITKEILEAANAYVKIEKDNKGNIYANEIINGAQGVQIPLSNLVSSGYVKEDQAKTIYEKKGNLDSDKDYYVLFVQEMGGESENYCSANEITSYVSWMPKGDNIYLCNEYGGTSGDGTSEEIVNYILDGYTPETYIVGGASDFYDIYTSSESPIAEGHIYKSKKNGLFLGYVDPLEAEQYYYYTGDISHNYVNFYEEIYRIINFNDTNIKLIKEKAITENYLLNETSNINWHEDLSDSRIAKALNTWFESEPYQKCKDDFSEKCTTYFGIANSFDNTVIEVSSNENGVSKFNVSNGSISQIDLKVGLITVGEANHAGVPTVFYTNFPGFNKATTFTSDSWLSQGDSTMVFDIKSEYYTSLYEYNIFISNNQKYMCDNSSYSCYYSMPNYGLDSRDSNPTIGVFIKSSIDINSNNDLNFVSTRLRPVITLKNKYLKISGRGTPESPYIITFNGE